MGNTIGVLLLLVVVFVVSMAFWRLLWSWWVFPMRAHRKLKRNGFVGPTPRFPMGNLSEIKRTMMTISSSDIINHDIHFTVVPYFSRWQKIYGKVFTFWSGTEPFVYVADPLFLRNMSNGVMGKSWGKPDVFKLDRRLIFGKGLVMIEGHRWARNRQVVSPAFSRPNLKAMSRLMVEATTNMLSKWESSGKPEIDVEKETAALAGEIIARTSFGMTYESGLKVFEKLKAMQVSMFEPNFYLGVPYANLMSPTQTRTAKRLCKELDDLLLSIIGSALIKKPHDGAVVEAGGNDTLLGLLLQDFHVDGRDTRELLDEFKTFFFGGQSTTPMALTWTLFLLAQHPTWQDHLREEIKDVVGGDVELLDPTTNLADLRKMSWVMNEALRLYPPVPNVQRQAREDIEVDGLTIPNGTNILIDVISMHHDRELWGDDAHEFKPERFNDDALYGGCSSKMGFLPFGFGGRMCIGVNMSVMEYKIVLTLILSSFSFSLSPTYRHLPVSMLVVGPAHGMPLVVRPL